MPDSGAGVVGPLLGVVVARWPPTAGFALDATAVLLYAAVRAMVQQIPHRVRTEHPEAGRQRGLGAIAVPLLIAALGLEAALGVVAALLLVGGVLAIRPLVVIGRLAAARKRDLEPRVRTLATLGIFEGASEASLERIAALVERIDVPAGTVVIREGDSPDNLYIALDGSLSVSIADCEVGMLGADDWFGEIGLFDQRPRTATVTVVDDATLWCIPGETFLAVLEHAGSAPSALLDGIADRLATHR